MGNKFLFLMIFTILFSPQFASADVIIPLSFLTIPLIPLMVIIEAVTFWEIANKIIKVPIGFWKLMQITFIANVATSLLGTFIPMYKYTSENLILIGVALVLSVFIEWGIYIPFLRKNTIKIIDILKISFVCNLITYSILVFFLLMSV
ncbi:MAG: hypothetical protein K8R34_14810 [Methanosarcinales archaeon]|nr:hypothetical protein [Methanosarcinales archaeon]